MQKQAVAYRPFHFWHNVLRLMNKLRRIADLICAKACQDNVLCALIHKRSISFSSYFCACAHIEDEPVSKLSEVICADLVIIGPGASCCTKKKKKKHLLSPQDTDRRQSEPYDTVPVPQNMTDVFNEPLCIRTECSEDSQCSNNCRSFNGRFKMRCDMSYIKLNKNFLGQLQMYFWPRGTDLFTLPMHFIWVRLGWNQVEVSVSYLKLTAIQKISFISRNKVDECHSTTD